MTLHDLWLWIEAHQLVMAAILLGTPLAVGSSALLLKVAGVREGSQQLANGGIALGLAAIVTELTGLVYVASSYGVASIGDISLVSLLGPWWLLLAGVVVEHLVHPGRQEGVRSWVRAVLMVGATIGVLVAVFSVLRIYMVVFSGILGFALFLGLIILVFWVMLRFLI